MGQKWAETHRGVFHCLAPPYAVLPLAHRICSHFSRTTLGNLFSRNGTKEGGLAFAYKATPWLH